MFRIVILFTLVPLFALAQEDPHAGCTAPPSYVPADLLQRPVNLRTGIGNSSETVTTQSKDAQAFYNQGLNYLESFVWIEASRSFHQALRIDSGLAMAYIGLSRVHSGLNDSVGAKAYFNRAKALISKVSDREKRRIEIREKQLAAMDNLEDAAAHHAYKKVIDSALAFDFNDPQLWLLRGNAEEPNASGRGQRGTSSSVAFYERVLQLQPDHATAHHYLVHSCETIGQIEKALKHGEAYAGLSPAIPHAVHMWAHDLRRVGRIDEAIVQFKKTDALERAYYKEENIDPQMDWHHGHNLDLLATCYQHKGQMKLAEHTMREADSLAAIDATRAFSMREVPNFLIHRARYEEALIAATQLTQSEFGAARAVGHALKGQALAALGRMDEADQSLVDAKRELNSIPRITPGIQPNYAAVEPWVEALRGELLLRSGKKAEGRKVLQSVQGALRMTPGADAWTQALFRLESMARTARETENWDLAEYTAQQMLEHDNAYGGSHLAMALVFIHRGEGEKARQSLQSAKQYWRDADPEFPELKQIAGIIALNR